MDEKADLQKYYDILKYQEELFAAPSLNYAKDSTRFKKLAKNKRAEISDTRRQIFGTLSTYYNALLIQQEFKEERTIEANMEIFRLKDKIEYYLEQERREALIELGYGEDEVKVLELWLPKPNLIYLR